MAKKRLPQRKSMAKIKLPERTLNRYRIKKILKHISPENKNTAYLLLQHISDYNILKWRDNGEIKYKGKIIPKSNIISLLKHVMNKTDISEQPGVHIFYKALRKINIPEYLITNVKALSVLKESDPKYDKNAWRPPGELVEKKKKKKKKK